MKIVVVIAMIIYMIHSFIMTLYIVDGTSMEPNYIDKEYLLVNRVSYYFREPKRGDVIVFTYPGELDKKFIKRIIGLPGEEVQFQNGEIYVYNSQHPKGYKLSESYIPTSVKTYASVSESKKIGPNEYYVLGDNRTLSSDSRVWGILPREYIIGYAQFSIWPTELIGLIRQPNY